jgi:hypothetical protein
MNRQSNVTLKLLTSKDPKNRGTLSKVFGSLRKKSMSFYNVEDYHEFNKTSSMVSLSNVEPEWETLAECTLEPAIFCGKPRCLQETKIDLIDRKKIAGTIQVRYIYAPMRKGSKVNFPY